MAAAGDTGLDVAAVESFLERHPELVEKWLQRKNSLPKARAVPAAPTGGPSEERRSSDGPGGSWGSAGGPGGPGPGPGPGGLQRRASQKELRKSFARSKAIHVNLTYDEHVHARAQEPLSSVRRRALLRKASSLPPTTAHILSALLESRVSLPQYPPTALDYKRYLKEHNERQFFLELVKDISNDLDLTSLSYKILIFVCLMVDADRGSLFLVEGTSAGKKTLVSKFFDVHAGTPLLPCGSTEDSNEVQVPWGKGIIGYVAEHGETVNIPDAYQVGAGQAPPGRGGGGADRGAPSGLALPPPGCPFLSPAALPGVARPGMLRWARGECRGDAGDSGRGGPAWVADGAEGALQWHSSALNFAGATGASCVSKPCFGTG